MHKIISKGLRKVGKMAENTKFEDAVQPKWKTRFFKVAGAIFMYVAAAALCILEGFVFTIGFAYLVPQLLVLTGFTSKTTTAAFVILLFPCALAGFLVGFAAKAAITATWKAITSVGKDE